MKAPAIFTWPTPWLWGAIAFIVIMDADGVSEVLGRTCAIIIAASLINYFRERRGSGESSETRGELPARLDEIERRLTDTQDVMIALSEKMDRWEEEGRPAGAEAPSSPVGSQPPFEGGRSL